MKRAALILLLRLRSKLGHERSRRRLGQYLRQRKPFRGESFPSTGGGDSQHAVGGES